MSTSRPASPVSPFTRDLAIGCALLAAVVAARSFSLAYPAELSADESELLVQVACYERDLMPWRSVDGSTIGPVNPWFLLLVKQTGWPLSYSGIHFLSAVLQGLLAVISYATVRLFAPLRPAAVMALAGCVALAGCASINFMYFATELVPALCLAAAVFALVWGHQGRPGALAALGAAAFLAGIAPWAKLQAAPMTLLVAVFAGWIAGRRPASSPGRRLVAGLAVVLAAALPSLIILIPVTLGGVLPDFWASYVVANLGYAGSFTASAAAERLLALARESELNGLLAGLAALAAWRFRPWRHRPAATPAPPGLDLLVLLYAAIAVFACIRPPHGFGHYHVFLINPLLLLLGRWLAADGPTPEATARGAWPWVGPAIAALVVLVPIGAFAAHHYFKEGAPLRQHLLARQHDATHGFVGAVTREILHLAPDADRLVVWGWMPALHVRTHLRPGSRHLISHFLIDPGPSRDRLRRQFLQDVQASRPDVIVDAVASDAFTWYWPVPTSGLESFPELAAYVRENYTLVRHIMGDAAGVPLRIFLRKPPPAGAPVGPGGPQPR